jgi:hypothetical protein
VGTDETEMKLVLIEVIFPSFNYKSMTITILPGRCTSPKVIKNWSNSITGIPNRVLRIIDER